MQEPRAETGGKASEAAAPDAQARAVTKQDEANGALAHGSELAEVTPSLVSSPETMATEGVPPPTLTIPGIVLAICTCRMPFR